jgi:hypothetical protein
MEIKIKNLEGISEIVDLVNAGNIYLDDDVIYFNGVPYVLSSAKAVVNTDLLEACKELVVDEVTMNCLAATGKKELILKAIAKAEKGETMTQQIEDYRKTETGNDVFMLGDFVEMKGSTGMIIGLAQNDDQLEKRVFQVVIVGGNGHGIKNIPYPDMKLLTEKQQFCCKINYSKFILGYRTWSD